jgi:hypothetical protein
MKQYKNLDNKGTYDIVFLNYNETKCYEVVVRNINLLLAYGLRKKKVKSGHYGNGKLKIVPNGTYI